MNPVVHKSKLAKLLKKYPTLQYYPIDKLDYPKPDDPKFRHADHVKVAAGWLLEEIGWAGKRIHDVGTPPHQALVVTNWGQATPKQLLAYTQAMQKDFYENFKIRLEPEVNII